jgi:glycine cleavage system pyridoxal-binding protein P
MPTQVLKASYAQSYFLSYYSVIAKAARLMPGRVVGLIGIDTLENVEYSMTQEELKKLSP